MTDCFDGLDESQKKAVLATEGPVLVLAGAGTGKTKTLVSRMAYIIKQGLCRPEEILCTTFTNKAAKEMSERLCRVIGPIGESIMMGTFHAVCLKILRKYVTYTEYFKGFYILGSRERTAIKNQALKELGCNLAPGEIDGAMKYMEFQHNNYDKENMLSLLNSRQIAFIKLYREKKKKMNSMEFGDLITEAIDLLQKHEQIKQIMRSTYKYLLVDEFQDSNRAQLILLKEILNPGSNNLCCVGDDDQVIYQWRGAEASNIIDFTKHFPGAKTFILGTNYRCTPNILSSALSVVSKGVRRVKKDLVAKSLGLEQVQVMQFSCEAEESCFLQQTIKAMMRSEQNSSLLKYSDIAVICRLNILRVYAVKLLAAANIPSQGKRNLGFYERKSVKDLLAYFHLINNPSADLQAFERAITFPKRGVGSKALGVIQKNFKDNLLDAVKASEAELTANTYNKIHEFLKEITRLKEALSSLKELPGAIQTLVLSSLKDKGDLPQSLKELPGDIQMLATDLSCFQSLQDFLDFTALESSASTPSALDAVNVLTIHGAKGLEFKRVFLIGFDQDIIPLARFDDLDLEEEDGEEYDAGEEECRRLAYVAMTRAKEKLFITTSRQRLINGRSRAFQPSSFLQDLPRDACKYSLLKKR